MTALARQPLEGYLLEEEIGRGKMGIVYRGKQLALGREVAIKVFSQTLLPDPSSVIRFLREARILAELNHPHIVQIYDAGHHGEMLYFVMESIQGPTLRSLLNMDGKLPVHLAAEYIAQAAEALDAAYTERQIIHRDMKPENLLLDRWGHLKVVDFGLACAPGLLEVTTAQTLVGSLLYTSPEQLQGKPLDNRSDIYALGVVLYELLTGTLPFSGGTLLEVAQAITAGHMVSPRVFTSDVSSKMEHILLIAMATNRDERFAQAGLMAKALRTLHLGAENKESRSLSLDRVSSGDKSLSDASLNTLLSEASEPYPYRPVIASRLTLPIRLQSKQPASLEDAEDTFASDRVMLAGHVTPAIGNANGV